MATTAQMSSCLAEAWGEHKHAKDVAFMELAIP